VLAPLPATVVLARLVAPPSPGSAPPTDPLPRPALSVSAYLMTDMLLIVRQSKALLHGADQWKVQERVDLGQLVVAYSHPVPVATTRLGMKRPVSVPTVYGLFFRVVPGTSGMGVTRHSATNLATGFTLWYGRMSAAMEVVGGFMFGAPGV